MKKKFGILDLGIFTIVSLVFLNSVHSLLGRHGHVGGLANIDAFQKKNRGSISKKGGKTSVSQGLASFVAYQIDCKSIGETFETDAEKVRISGPFCGYAKQREIASTELVLKKVKEVSVKNETAPYVATVISDASTGRFTTDFIPVAMGKNKIRLNFQYKDQTPYPIELSIVRK